MVMTEILVYPVCECVDRCECGLDYDRYSYDTPPYAMCQTLQYGPSDHDPGDEDHEGGVT